jgi:NADPH-dependent glutamate synthase beta subunit-like oxidoreductase/NAD-dependent dihydropyrimidine dehydrogenase PreA subunit
VTLRGAPVDAPDFPVQAGAPAPCRGACPVRTDAAAYVALVAEGRLADAYDVARLHNPLASVCGRICSAPCERACRRGVVDTPIAIRALKRVLAESFGPEAGLASRWHRAGGTVPPATGAPIAVIGAGPAGLAAAHDLRLAGHAVTLLEADAVPGGMMHMGIPAFRLPRAIITAEIDAIVGLGITLRTNTRVGRDVTIEALLDTHARVLVTIGCHGGRALPVPGGDLPGVVRAVDFLRTENARVAAGRDGRTLDAGPVVIVGGGSVAFDAARSAWRGAASPHDDQAAVDAARSAARGGSRGVTMISPETRAQLRVPPEELHEADTEGVTLLDGHGVVRLVGETRVEGIELAPVRSLLDAQGRFAPQLDLARARIIPASTVVLAIGQLGDTGFLHHLEGMARTGWGGVATDREGRTAHPRIRVAGDIASGPRDLIDAIAHGQRVAAALLHELGTPPRAAPPPVPAAPPMPRATRFWSGYDAIARAPLPVLDTPARSATSEVEHVLDAVGAAAEGARCLRCDEQLQFATERCIACALCIDVCPQRSLAFHDVATGLALAFDEDTCIRCGLCVHRCPTDALAFALLPTGRRAPAAALPPIA